MTEKLYYRNAYDSDFDAVVVSCNGNKDRYEIILDRTLFYPEGGGQPADNGMINDANIFDVHENGSTIVHYSDKPIDIGSRVNGKIDMKRRFRLMQQHSGEHIVSGLIHSHFGYDNVGFHMGSDCITIDFNGELTEDNLVMIEKEANEAVYRNFLTDIFYPEKEELGTLEYRSKKALEGDVRIVRFEGCDICACCGLHVVRTGEIGIIKILSHQKYKGGTRVFMLSGIQAYEDYAQKNKLVLGISNLLSAKPYDVLNSVERLMEERNNIKEQLVSVKRKLFEIKADKIDEGTKCAVVFEDNLEAFELRQLCEILIDKAEFAAVLCGNDADGYKYAIGSKDKDILEFAKDANKVLNGRGGGRGDIVQGSFAADRDSIDKYIKENT
ncbi:MAG: DHHA1 domain-containing protein [Candidatus Metalachnospira sp.]|nr:DHHA1 domain-containing protein [Candidatus Metalachnospira sp.]